MQISDSAQNKKTLDKQHSICHNYRNETAKGGFSDEANNEAIRYFLLRDIRTRPMQFLASVLVAVSAITALMLMLLYMEAAWRARVMPDQEYNYHFAVQNLSYAEKNDIANQPWAQACYEIVEYDDDGNLLYDYFRIRVTWDEVTRWGVHAREIFDKYDMWHDSAYRTRYESSYNFILGQLQKRYYGADTVNGTPITTLAEQGAKREILQWICSDDLYILHFLPCHRLVFPLDDRAIHHRFLYCLPALPQNPGYGTSALGRLISGFVCIQNLAGMTDERHPEFGIFRALGITRKRLSDMVNVQSALRAVIIAVLAVAVFLTVSDTRVQSSAITAPIDDSLPVLLAKGLLDLIGTAIFVFPSVFGGVRLSLRRFFRRPIIDALRESE